ncbi:MAG TPA: hypothetical protein VMW50_10015 [Dehalococcoidia bacterium]|jgi:hypothetical protein|nr:hypothetical protein [Dehalococcoidia bacterium]
MNNTVTVGNRTYKVYTETRPSGCLAVVFESGEKGTMSYYQSSTPVRSYETVEKVYDKVVAGFEKQDAHYAWINSIKAIPNEERPNHPDFAYFRHKVYGVAMYFKSKWSPTGVENMGGFSEEEFYKLGLSSRGVAQRNDF